MDEAILKRYGLTHFSNSPLFVIQNTSWSSKGVGKGLGKYLDVGFDPIG